MAGLTLELGDRLVINGTEVTFRGWVDQSQTAIEVSDGASDGANTGTRRIHAKSIYTLSRSLSAPSTKSANPENPEATEPSTSDHAVDANIPEPEQDLNNSQDSDQAADPQVADRPEPSESKEPNEPPRSQEIELPPEPEYNAWEVWTYLERQRLKTLKLLNTFQAEWEANRFVREAERNTPPNLRVHYEIRPVVLDESVINAAKAASQEPSETPKPDETTTYTDAIDVEVIG